MSPEEFECVICGESFKEFPDTVEMGGRYCSSECRLMLMVYDTTLDEEGHIARMADVVDGVGEATAERVVNHFDSTVELFEADLDEIAEIEGIGESRAKEILSYTSPLNEELNKHTE